MKFRRLVLATLLAGAVGFQDCSIPGWVNTVESDADVAAPIAASLIAVIDPPLTPVVTLIENGFNTLVKTLDTYKAMPTATNLQAVQSAFQAVSANVAQLESAAQIKDSSIQDRVTSIVQLLAQVVTEIAALLPPGMATAIKPPAKVEGEAKGWRAKDFRREFNKIVKGDPRFKELK